jgi:hypothetical protein
LQLLRQMAAVERRASAGAAATSADQRYIEELIQLEEAIAKNNTVQAFSHACKLRALRRQEPHTKEACDRAFALYVAALQTRLETDDKEGALNEVECELLKLLKVEPSFRTAIDLLDQVRRRGVHENPARRAVAEEKLTEADRRLTETEPVLALQALEEVFLLNLPEYRTRAQTLRELAIVMAKRQLKAMILDGHGEHDDAFDMRAKVLGNCSPASVEEVLAWAARHRAKELSSQSFKAEISRIMEQARNSSAPALSVLFRMDRAIRQLRRRHGDVPSSELAKLRTVEQDVLQTMWPWSRGTYRLLSRITGTAFLYRKASPA